MSFYLFLLSTSDYFKICTCISGLFHLGQKRQSFRCLDSGLLLFLDVGKAQDESSRWSPETGRSPARLGMLLSRAVITACTLWLLFVCIFLSKSISLKMESISNLQIFIFFFL